MSFPDSYFCTISSGEQIELRSSKRPGVIQSFGTGMVSAIIQGNQIIGQTKQGNTNIYEVVNGYAVLRKPSKANLIVLYEFSEEDK